ncbi:WD40-repeat-containing domain protein [Irpex rosettiformis]|uniref:WD40-repeat-containing domain protein n=1 Tax=Irpex rosettiformis TaxID=378272 RepID=A0ACB8U2D8_9APHY|nr:WD40-repeat-containing domain protein [Irpex rosettiformis]
MRVRTLEIRWHDSKPISTCDFQPIPFKKARPTQDKGFTGQAYKLATGGEDNHVRLWAVHPNIMPPSVLESAGAETAAPRPSRVEYLATLSRHSAAVNVVRFSPNDGMIIIWAQSNTPPAASYGSDLTAEELQYEKEYWKPRITFRCSTMQVYDLAWSPSGEYIIAGSTDNCARIFTASEGKCLHEIAEHSHYVQGVAWDPLNEYIATQSSDRSMHIYSISYKQGNLEVHAVGKNSRMAHRHSRTPSRPNLLRRESMTSETESVNGLDLQKDESIPSGSQASALLTPTHSVPSTPSLTMFPPPSIERSSSRRSSFSGSNAPSSPATYTRYARSPSPMPALPAIRVPTTSWSNVKLYGDESYSNFFRRLTFSPDGGLLLTPAGQFEDPTVIPGLTKANDDQHSRGRKGNPNTNTSESSSQVSTSSVYIYSRGNFARPPIARLPGHKKASVAVKFSPILYELRTGVSVGTESYVEPKIVPVERGLDKTVSVDIIDPKATVEHTPDSLTLTPTKSHAPAPSSSIVAPSPRIAIPSPALSAIDSIPPITPLSKPATPGIAPSYGPSAVFALPYRMLYAVATMDTIAIYDTQQAGPICMLTKLHYDEFTDMSWSPDGQCLMLSSRDGYCTIVVFDEIIPAYHTQQQTLQFQSIAHHHSLSLASNIATPSSTPSVQSVALPTISPALTPVVPMKRGAEPPLTPAASVDENPQAPAMNEPPSTVAPSSSSEASREPPKKKRRAALTRVDVS